MPSSPQMTTASTHRCVLGGSFPVLSPILLIFFSTCPKLAVLGSMRARRTRIRSLSHQHRRAPCGDRSNQLRKHAAHSGVSPCSSLGTTSRRMAEDFACNLILMPVVTLDTEKNRPSTQRWWACRIAIGGAICTEAVRGHVEKLLRSPESPHLL